MPFKKELLVKSEQKLGGKDAKKLIAEAQQRLGDDAKELLKGDLKQRKSAGGVVCRIICNEGLPMLFELGNSGLLPTLPALWKAPSALPALIIPPEAARFLLNGADLLLPGVRGCDATVPDLPAGTPACVRIMGNPAAVAVGVLAVDGAAIAMAVAEPCEHKGGLGRRRLGPIVVGLKVASDDAGPEEEPILTLVDDHEPTSHCRGRYRHLTDGPFKECLGRAAYVES